MCNSTSDPSSLQSLNKTCSKYNQYVYSRQGNQFFPCSTTSNAFGDRAWLDGVVHDSSVHLTLEATLGLSQ